MQDVAEEGGQEKLWLKKYPKDIPWDGEIPTYPVFEMLDKTSQDYAKNPAFDFLGRRWNWGQIGELVNKMAKGLQSMGVRKGVNVALFMPNCTYYLVSYYAVLKAGGTVVNLNPLYAIDELVHLVEDSESDIAITLDLDVLYGRMHGMLADTCLNRIIVCRFIDLLPFPKDVIYWATRGSDLAKVDDHERCVWFHHLIQNDGNPDKVDINPEEDIAVLQYTGGTTGTPKGAMLTHANVSANVEQAVMWFKGARFGEERMLGVLPFFHVFAMTAVMNMSVRCAFEIIAIPRFDLDETLKTIQKKKPHYFPAIPPIYNAINNYSKTKKYNLTSLRYCISGGSTLPVEVKKVFEANTGCVLVEGYGLSETSPVVTANPLEGENKLGSIGMPLPGTIIELIDPDDKKTRVRQGERGEICIRGPQVMKGYWNNQDETANVLVDGLLYTGDIGTMDSEGYIYVVDRLKDMIITNGYNVFPRNVEESIYLHPSVAECIVAGLEDEMRGEIVKAWVKPKDGRNLTAEDLKDFLQDKLSKMEMPRQIEIRDNPLPKSTIGKLSRKELMKEIAEKSKGEL